jgi:hypothetical protein
MVRLVASSVIALAFAFANVGPTLCAAIHAHAPEPVQHAHHGSHASHQAAPVATAGDAWAPVPDASHAAACPDPAHCGVTILGPAPRAVVLAVSTLPVAAPPTSFVDGAPQQLPDPATPPPKS